MFKHMILLLRNKTNKLLKNLSLVLFTIATIIGSATTTYAAIGDISNYVLTDSFGRDWYKPFDGLTNKTWIGQRDALVAANFTAAKLSEVASMYCDQYESGAGTPCSTDGINYGANNFQEFMTDFGFGTVTVDTRYARLMGENDLITGRGIGTNGADGACLPFTVFCQSLDSTLVQGTTNINIGTQSAPSNYGMMYYKTATPAPSVTALLSISLILIGWTAYSSRTAKRFSS